MKERDFVIMTNIILLETIMSLLIQVTDIEDLSEEEIISAQRAIFQMRHKLLKASRKTKPFKKTPVKKKK